MRICILGDTTRNIDEGMKKITFNLSKQLSKNNDVLVLNPLDVFSWKFWKLITEFKPKIIHYIPGPSIKSFMLMKILSLYFRDAKAVMSTPLPKLSRLSRRFIHLFKPSIILVQSKYTEKLFKEKGFVTKFFPLSGIDTERFVSCPNDIKMALREKYGIDENKFIILHVGHIKEGRNIQIFKKIQKENNQVIIVGSTYMPVEDKICQDLKKKGCILFTNYLDNIDEIYALSDCYIFPVVDKLNSIEIPLSILEAMSCNLPVITTIFGGLLIFERCKGLYFFEKVHEIDEILKEIKMNNIDMNTRDKVLCYSWTNISNNLLRIYEELVKNNIVS